MGGVRERDGVKDNSAAFDWRHFCKPGDQKRRVGRKHRRSEQPCLMLMLSEMVPIPQENARPSCEFPAPARPADCIRPASGAPASAFLKEPGEMGKGELEDILFWLFYFSVKQETRLSAEVGMQEDVRGLMQGRRQSLDARNASSVTGFLEVRDDWVRPAAATFCCVRCAQCGWLSPLYSIRCKRAESWLCWWS